MADNATAKLEAELWQRIEAAKAAGAADEYGFLTRVQHVLWQYKAVTPAAPDYVPCHSCATTGRRPEPYKTPDGQWIEIQVLCRWCQGSGRTWNPHPTVQWPNVKAEL